MATPFIVLMGIHWELDWDIEMGCHCTVLGTEVARATSYEEVRNEGGVRKPTTDDTIHIAERVG